MNRYPTFIHAHLPSPLAPPLPSHLSHTLTLPLPHLRTVGAEPIGLKWEVVDYKTCVDVCPSPWNRFTGDYRNSGHSNWLVGWLARRRLIQGVVAFAVRVS